MSRASVINILNMEWGDKSPSYVYIGRGSIWGNPFRIGKDGLRKEVLKKYEAWLETQPELLRRIPELQGKILGCFCAPKLCHGDVLAKKANAL